MDWGTAMHEQREFASPCQYNEPCGCRTKSKLAPAPYCFGQPQSGHFRKIQRDREQGHSKLTFGGSSYAMGSGTVTMKFTVDETGSVKNPQAVSGLFIFREPAINCVKQWRYQARHAGWPARPTRT
jgi:hypothetical protein